MMRDVENEENDDLEEDFQSGKKNGDQNGNNGIRKQRKLNE